jgi:hypothetical protein
MIIEHHVTAVGAVSIIDRVRLSFGVEDVAGGNAVGITKTDLSVFLTEPGSRADVNRKPSERAIRETTWQGCWRVSRPEINSDWRSNPVLTSML